jgi:hypothetical protein
MPGIENEFTSEEWERIRAHHKTQGMTFEVFLPESCAKCCVRSSPQASSRMPQKPPSWPYRTCRGLIVANSF